MVVTPFALIVLLLGTIELFRGTPLTMFLLFLFATLFGGSAAFILVAAGGSSIPPAQFLLMFLALRLLLPGRGQMDALKRAVWKNRFLVTFVGYGVISAFTLPTIFARTMSVTPLKPIPGADLFAVRPLHMTPQNFTTAFYLVGTLIAGIAATAAMQRPGAPARLVKLGSIIAIVHAAFGFSSVILAGTVWDQVLGLFRNGNYAQLNQSFSGLVRMNGIWPEPSGFAAYGTTWCIFMIELWLRDVASRRTGFAGLLLLLALIASTSSTAYVSLGAYGLFSLIRFALTPGAMPARKQLILIALTLLGFALVLTAFVVIPSLASKVTHILALMTVDKSESVSGIQRAFWAKQGIDIFFNSYGLGIGAGSFRSSSLLTAILGSMGIIGAVAFTCHLVQAVQPFRRDFLVLRNLDLERAVGGAASTTALLMLASSMISAPSPDPGILWAVVCGIALALQPTPQRRPPHRHANRMATA